MPITKRLRVHQGSKGMEQCLNYVMNDDKTESGVLVTGYNCHPEMATFEFKQNNNRYGKLDDDLSCYHVIQSFDYRDKITHEQVNEIGIKLCKELYTDFQCVVATHVDRGHVHNHIVINATSLHGRKLDDRLANTKEGLYGLRTASDKLALEYGCSIIHDPPKIGRYKSKNYVYASETANWKTVIKQKIDEYKVQCDSFEALLEKLSYDGFSIKTGKHIAIKPYGKDRYTRMYKLGEGYTDDDLRDYFADKDKAAIEGIDLSVEYPDFPQSEIYTLQKSIYRESKDSIIYSQNGMDEKRQYPEYRVSRFQEKQRCRNAAETLKFLNSEKIYNYDDLIIRGRENEKKIKELQEEYNKRKSEMNTLSVPYTLANSYIEKYNEYQNWLEIKKTNKNTKKTDSIKEFEAIKEQLNNAELPEVRELLAKYSGMQQNANHLYAQLSYPKHKQSIFEMLRMNTLEQHYIKHMTFSKNMIDDERSTDTTYCIKLPYTKQYIYLPKEQVAWTNYDVRAVMYLRDDDEYYLYDKSNNIIGIAKGKELDDISLKEKERIQSLVK